MEHRSLVVVVILVRCSAFRIGISKSRGFGQLTWIEIRSIDLTRIA